MACAPAVVADEPPAMASWVPATVDGLETDVNADLGLFAQDRWTIKRLTIEPGVRLDYFNASVPEQREPAGRFVPAHTFAAVSDIPNWKDVSPRLGAAFDQS